MFLNQTLRELLEERGVAGAAALGPLVHAVEDDLTTWSGPNTDPQL